MDFYDWEFYVAIVLLRPYYIMRCLSFAFANKPNANEMYMQRKEFYVYYTLCFYQNLVFWGSHLNALYFFSENCSDLFSNRYGLSAPNPNCFAFLDPIPPYKPISPYSTENCVCVDHLTQMKLTQTT